MKTTGQPPMLQRPFSRRSFLGYAGAGLVGAAGFDRLGLPLVHALSSVPYDRRTLVVVEMAGGNDGLSMVVPHGVSGYYASRPRTAVPANQVLPLNSQVGLHPALKQLSARGVAAVQGVGVPVPDLSHFEMLRRLWAGNSSGQASSATGFLGRLCDQVGRSDAPAVGVSLATGPSPALVCEHVSTASLPGPDQLLGVPADDGFAEVWRAGFRAMTHPDRSDTVAMLGARQGAASAVRLAGVIEHLGPPGGSYPANDEFASQLQFAARIIAARVGTRVIHVPMGADFDTHENHLSRCAANLARLDAGLGAFLNDLEARGLLSSVLVMTTSEFGRRIDDNASNGLDHGAASMALMAGAVTPGVYGALPSFSKLDADGDLIATVTLEEYLATAAESWMGVPAASVLPGSPRPLSGIVS